ncbi:hypothetical protein BC940DRAFT_14171 [Gongronella butleri]|nr:hypothetical protein BC940DRAFT_14171 [Gongronella butleri]
MLVQRIGAPLVLFGFPLHAQKVGKAAPITNEMRYFIKFVSMFAAFFKRSMQCILKIAERYLHKGNVIQTRRIAIKKNGVGFHFVAKSGGNGEIALNRRESQQGSSSDGQERKKKKAFLPFLSPLFFSFFFFLLLSAFFFYRFQRRQTAGRDFFICLGFSPFSCINPIYPCIFT